MNVFDYDAIRLLREALWRPGRGAAVMVGAGLSLNALPAKPDVKAFPQWSELILKIIDQLYPLGKDGRNGDQQHRWRERAEKMAHDTSGFLRIAEEYKARFNQAQLNILLNSLIPDYDYNPSSLHDSLVKLPWSDIFTTNWDTLLERSANRVTGGQYSVVFRPDQLPSEASPRIIKLHGTLQVSSRLILSEEDFRTYPLDHAPFVNTIRQAMLEKVFCLLGFSGSDPNFISWAGWARDVLGNHTNKVMICGLFDNSPGQLAYLQSQNFLPIDLSPLVAGEPAERRHRAAIEAFLAYLEEGRPIVPHFWPRQHRTQAKFASSPLSRENTEAGRQNKDIVQTITDALRILRLIKENDEQNLLDSRISYKKIRSIIDLLSFDRLNYPKWIVIPLLNRDDISIKTRRLVTLEWETLPEYFFHNSGNELSLLSNQKSRQNSDNLITLKYRQDISLNIISEIAWRANASLIPITDGFINAIESLKNSRFTEKNQDLQPLELWIVLLNYHRLEWRMDSFLKLTQQLRKTYTVNKFPHAEYSLNIDLQWCLSDLALGNLAGARQLIDHWPECRSDPFWITRKAAVLCELGYIDEALKHAKHALEAIQSAAHPTDQTFALPSREGWTMLLLRRLGYEILSRENAPDSGNDTAHYNLEELRRLLWDVEERLEFLSAKRCNAEDELERCRVAMAIKQEGELEGLAAWQFAAMVDTVGLPYTCGRTDVVLSSILEAVRQMENRYPVRAALLLLRAAPSPALIEGIRLLHEPESLRPHEFDRPEQSGLTIDELQRMIDAAISALPYAHRNGLQESANPGLHYARQLVADQCWRRFDIASRLLKSLLPRLAHEIAERMTNAGDGSQSIDLKDRLQKVLAAATSVYRDPTLCREPLRPQVLAILFEAMVRSALATGDGDSLLDLADLPIPGHDLSHLDNRRLPEPLAYLDGIGTLPPLAASSERIAQVRQRLTAISAATSTLAAARATRRQAALRRCFSLDINVTILD